jgi:L-aspartate oxidase
MRTNYQINRVLETDLLVIGSGVAGLFAALTALDRGEDVLLVTKRGLEESNTRYAQGGVAAPVARDDYPELHAVDTMQAGAGLNDYEAVSVLTNEAGACIGSLEELGVPFDRTEDGLAVTREAAHSVSRVIHAGGDATGAAIEHTLAARFLERGGHAVQHSFVTELALSAGRVTGATFIGMQGSTPCTVRARRVLLATGGAGQLFSRTTNPDVATGDGLALAFAAGAEVTDLEFFQFHPTALAIENLPAFLISEAARGEGGVLRDLNRNAFMRRYHPDAELAPRDVVARGIAAEMERQDLPHVLLDLTHLGGRYLRGRFPTIYATCASYGIDISRSPIPVAPAAHYFMGGVRTDAHGRTSLPGLLAAGEVACTGVHGANRLASNSLMEGLVFGRRAALTACEGQETELGRVPSGTRLTFNEVDRPGLANGMSRRDMQTLNWSHLGVNRTAEGLAHAVGAYGGKQDLMEGMAEDGISVEEQEARNMRLVSSLMAQAALARTESRGAHFRTDFPGTDVGWSGHIVLTNESMGFIREHSEPEERATA